MGGYGKVKESNFLKAIWPEERLESRPCKIVFNRYSNFSASESRAVHNQLVATQALQPFQSFYYFSTVRRVQGSLVYP